jgi:hypothetical protein
MSRRWLFFIFAAVLFIAIAIFTKKEVKAPNPYRNVKSFEDCAAAKLPVAESYPRECRTPDGKVFTEIVKEN